MGEFGARGEGRIGHWRRSCGRHWRMRLSSSTRVSVARSISLANVVSQLDIARRNDIGLTWLVYVDLAGDKRRMQCPG